MVAGVGGKCVEVVGVVGGGVRGDGGEGEGGGGAVGDWDGGV